MKFETASRSSQTAVSRRASQLAVLLSGFIATLGTAAAQVPGATIPSPSVAERGGPLQILGRLDAAAIGLIVIAFLIFLLLAWRVAAMVRRERPAAMPPRRRPRPAADTSDPLDRSTLQQTTDWGFDQNKRAAQVREPVVVPNTSNDLLSLEAAVTQWSISDVERGGNPGVVPDDTMGKSFNRTPSPYRTSFNPYFKRELPISHIEVVEVADTLLQAELLVQLGDPKQAMTLLSHHIRETEKPGPAAWLMLLNLYQSTGREAQYNALSSGFRTLFNAEVPPWATSPDVLARDLEAYPQVMSRLQTTWSGPLARKTVESYLNDDRGGSRQGFSLTAYRELLFLNEIRDTLDAIAQEDEDRYGIQRKLGSLTP